MKIAEFLAYLFPKPEFQVTMRHVIGLWFFKIFGAVAQLGERRVRNAKVRGSIPLCSTKSILTARQINS